MSHFSYKIAFLFFLITAIHPVAADAQRPPNPLNVLLITIDTLRADRLSCYHPDSVHTPNIDRLASRGVLFTSAFAHNPLTLPSHANILLGITPLLHGVHTNTNSLVESRYTTLAEHLQSFNYKTAAFVAGATLDSRFGLDQGFDVYDDTFDTPGLHKFERAERKAETVVKAALSWLESHPEPWFVWIHLFDPHFPYEPPAPFKQSYPASPYNGEVAYADDALGRVFGHLEKNSLDRNTLIILTSDHGESLGEHGEQTHGFFAYNSTLWVPLIISAPGIKPAIRTETAAHIDIFPTVCDFLGTAKLETLQGLSLLPVLSGDRLPERQIYFESLYGCLSEGWAPLRGYICTPIKYIESPIPEFYDLSADFKETTNLASQVDMETYKRNLEKLQERDSSPKEGAVQNQPNTEMIKKLRSLGYTAGSSRTSEEIFGPEDDIKVKMPLYNDVLEAYSLKDRGAAAQGLSALEDICSTPEAFPTAFYFLAKLFRETGNIDRSLDTLLAGMNKFPRSFDLLLEYTDTLLAVGDYQKLITTLTSKPLPQMDQDASLYNKLGVAYSKIQQPQKALEAFYMATAVDDGYADALHNMGSIHLSQFLAGRDPLDYKKAHACFSKVLALIPNNGEAHNSMGALYFGGGYLDKAINSWEKAIQFSSGLGKTYYMLGLAYLSKNVKDKALFYFAAYKNNYYSLLSEEEKVNLDRLISLCR